MGTCPRKSLIIGSTFAITLRSPTSPKRAAKARTPGKNHRETERKPACAVMTCAFLSTRPLICNRWRVAYVNWCLDSKRNLSKENDFSDSTHGRPLPGLVRRPVEGGPNSPRKAANPKSDGNSGTDQGSEGRRLSERICPQALCLSPSVPKGEVCAGRRPCGAGRGLSVTCHPGKEAAQIGPFFTGCCTKIS